MRTPTESGHPPFDRALESKTAHVTELRRLILEKAPYTPLKAARSMLREAERERCLRIGPERDDQTWIWSDLHLHHEKIIRYCNRPFLTADEMDARLLQAWTEQVGARDRVIVVGDLAKYKGASDNRRNAIRDLPGEKVLVRGNHEFERTGSIREAGIDDAWMTVLCEGTPPLLLTHVPLARVPDGTVNVHGHTHNNAPLRPGPYVNVCVEQTNYRPVRLRDVRKLGQVRLGDPRPRAETTAGELETVR